MPGPTGSGNDARKRRAARIELAMFDEDEAWRGLKAAALIRGQELLNHVYTATNSARLDTACVSYSTAVATLAKARGMANPRRRARGEE